MRGSDTIAIGNATADNAVATLADPGDFARWHITGIMASFSTTASASLTLDIGAQTFVFTVYDGVALTFHSPILCGISTAVTLTLATGGGSVVGRVTLIGYSG